MNLSTLNLSQTLEETGLTANDSEVGTNYIFNKICWYIPSTENFTVDIRDLVQDS